MQRGGRWRQPEFGKRYRLRCIAWRVLFTFDKYMLRHKWQWLCHRVLDTPYFLPCYDDEWNTYPTIEMLDEEHNNVYRE